MTRVFDEAKVFQAYEMALRKTPINEICEELDLSQQTVSLYVRRARKIIRETSAKSAKAALFEFMQEQNLVIRESLAEIERMREKGKNVSPGHLANISTASQRKATAWGIVSNALELTGPDGGAIQVTHDHEFNFAEFGRLFSESLDPTSLNVIDADGFEEPVDTASTDANPGDLLSLTG